MAKLNAVEVVKAYLIELTGVDGHWQFVESAPGEVAIFRRLSFVVPDELTMIRLRMLAEVTPKAQSSVGNGLLVGVARVDQRGRLRRRLDPRQVDLLRYLLAEPLGAYTFQPAGRGRWTIAYPQDLPEVLIARAIALTGAAPRARMDAAGWRIGVDPIRIAVSRFRDHAEIRATPGQLAALLRLAPAQAADFHRLSRPCVVIGFGGAVHVHGAMSLRPERQSQLPDLAFIALFAAYERFKAGFLGARRRRVSARWELPENTALPARRGRPPARQATDPILAEQRRFLHDCIQSAPVARGRLRGRISAPDPAIYPPIWMPDHFLNALALTDLEPGLAKDLVRGGFIHWMSHRGADRGRMPLKKDDRSAVTYAPVWVACLSAILARAPDRRLAREILPFLRRNDAYLTRHCQRDGFYIRDANCFWNDYSTGPKTLPGIAGIGFHCLAAMQQQLILDLEAGLGREDRALRQAHAALVERINRHFWDEEAGGYFDYDLAQGRIYTTRRGGRFWGLDNLLPLTAGIATPGRAARLARHLRSSRSYGRYAAITTDLSPDFMDERRLMIWPMTNWLVIQGLRRYRLDAIADGIAERILSAMLRIWHDHHALPESLSGICGLAPSENPNLAGVGCWSAFALYLDEVGRRRRTAARLPVR